MEQPLIFGESLFDIFPGEEKVLGGAPFNVSWNLTAFGAKPIFISRVGDDALGQEIIATMQNSGMDTCGVQIDKDHPTGTVTISMSGGTHQFNINAEQAYDFISAREALEIATKTKVGLLYFGTLALRNSHSRATAEELLALDFPVFVDINLRDPWWNEDIVSMVLDKAKWAKLNDEEILHITRTLYAMELSIEEAIEHLFSSLNLDMLIVTCGEKGAFIRNSAELLFRPAPVIENMKDTVGAGDAFTAVSIFGLLNNWESETILARALDFAADICTVQGAVSVDKSIYLRTIESWK